MTTPKKLTFTSELSNALRIGPCIFLFHRVGKTTPQGLAGPVLAPPQTVADHNRDRTKQTQGAVVEDAGGYVGRSKIAHVHEPRKVADDHGHQNH